MRELSDASRAKLARRERWSTISAARAARWFVSLEGVVLIWIGILLADGRAFSHLGVGPVYVTEPLLAVLLVVAARRLLMAPHSGLIVSAAIFGVLSIVAAAGLLLRTDLGNSNWLRNAVIVYYAGAAVVGAACVITPPFVDRGFVVILVAAYVALALVITGHGGPREA